MWETIKDNFNSLRKILVQGFFGLLPAVLFAGLIGGVLALLGIDDKVNSNIYYMYAGVCGGSWLRKKLTLLELDSMPDESTKWDIYRKLEKN